MSTVGQKAMANLDEMMGGEALPLGELVAVLWVDAYGDYDGGWHPAHSGTGYPLARCISVGRLIQCDQKVVALAPHWTIEPEEVSGLEGGRVILPTSTVLTMQVFEGSVASLMAFRDIEEVDPENASTH